ncbi:MAG: hypothetical protein IGQ88_00275 [Gloeomargaritaceae cyanobacterium C42_A2020_066]|nr:hypothetical protein [Gloeomargaritaceae cyanobacterium C42_A2020_066]
MTRFWLLPGTLAWLCLATVAQASEGEVSPVPVPDAPAPAPDIPGEMAQAGRPAPIQLESIEFNAEGTELRLRTNQPLTYSSSWSPDGQVYRLTLQNTQLSAAGRRSLNTQANPLVRVAWQQVDATTLVLLLYPTAAGKIREVVHSSATIAIRLEPQTPVLASTPPPVPPVSTVPPSVPPQAGTPPPVPPVTSVTPRVPPLAGVSPSGRPSGSPPLPPNAPVQVDPSPPTQRLTVQLDTVPPPDLGPTLDPIRPERSPELEAEALGRSDRLPTLTVNLPPLPPPPPPAAENPLVRRPTILTTADQLKPGEVTLRFLNRTYYGPSRARDGLAIAPTLGVHWGVSKNWELGLDAQTLDNSQPVTQGSFDVQRGIVGITESPNIFQEVTFQVKRRLWQNADGNLMFSAVAAASQGAANRPYTFQRPGELILENNPGIITSLEFPVTFQGIDPLSIEGGRWTVTASPRVAFFPEDHNIAFRRLPGSTETFGATGGLSLAGSFRFNQRVLAWGDIFFPLFGNNSLDRDSGDPDKVIVFNAGLRYFLNPRFGLDVFASNALGNTGPLGLVGDTDLIAFGVGFAFLPDVTQANRRFPEHFGETVQPPPLEMGGFGFIDGGTLPRQRWLTTLYGGSQGVLGSMRYSVLDDVELGLFADVVSGTTDEGLAGIFGKVRFLHQAEGDPVTLSAGVTVARTNNVFINYLNNNRNEFQERGFTKSGFNFTNEQAGESLVFTFSLPLYYRFSDAAALWFTPTVVGVQREGVEAAGFNLGGQYALVPSFSVIAEVGADFLGRNVFEGNTLTAAIPWTVGLRWQPFAPQDVKARRNNPGPSFDLYVTNRVGASPFEYLRVRADGELAIGAGVTIPIQF